MDTLVASSGAFLQDNYAFVVAFFAAGALYYGSHLGSSLLFSSRYNELSKDDKAEWCSRVVSNVNAFIVTYGALKVLFSGAFDEHPFTAWDKEGEVYINIILGYLTYDLLLCLSYKQLRTPSTLFHHGLGITSYAIVLATRNVQYFGLLWLASELTTPFVNTRWFLYTLKQSSSTLYTINGLLMTLSFILWRVLFIPVSAAYTLYYYSDQIKLTMTMLSTFVAIPSITLLNIYWTFLMVRGILKFLSKPAGSKAPKSPPHQKAA